MKGVYGKILVVDCDKQNYSEETIDDTVYE